MQEKNTVRSADTLIPIILAGLKRQAHFDEVSASGSEDAEPHPGVTLGPACSPKLFGPHELFWAVGHFLRQWFTESVRPCLLVLAGGDPEEMEFIARRMPLIVRAAAPLARNTGRSRTLLTESFVIWQEVQSRCALPGYWAPDDLLSASLLIVQDFGGQIPVSDDALNQLSLILARREDQLTVLTTPVVSSLWAETYDARIAERLQHNSIIVEWPTPHTCATDPVFAQSTMTTGFPRRQMDLGERTLACA